MLKLFYGITVILAGFAANQARADALAGCNYTFDVGPYEDRGTVQILKKGVGLVMRVVQDDQVVVLDKVTLSSANGDQARSMMTQDASFKEFSGRARIFPDDVARVDEYVVPSQNTGIFGDHTPQANYFAFYAKDGRYLGGFGIYQKSPYVCDWV